MRKHEQYNVRPYIMVILSMRWHNNEGEREWHAAGVVGLLLGTALN